MQHFLQTAIINALGISYNNLSIWVVQALLKAVSGSLSTTIRYFDVQSQENRKRRYELPKDLRKCDLPRHETTCHSDERHKQQKNITVAGCIITNENKSDI